MSDRGGCGMHASPRAARLPRGRHAGSQRPSSGGPKGEWRCPAAQRIDLNSNTPFCQYSVEVFTSITSGSKPSVVEVVLDRLAYHWIFTATHRQPPHLTLGQIYSALAYYYDHQQVGRRLPGCLSKLCRRLLGAQSLGREHAVRARPRAYPDGASEDFLGLCLGQKVTQTAV